MVLPMVASQKQTCELDGSTSGYLTCTVKFVYIALGQANYIILRAASKTLT